MLAKYEKTVGVMGGMGPEAAVDFLQRLLTAVDAKDDSDHLHVILDNNSKIPSRIAHIIEGTGEDPTPILRNMARNLAHVGADIIAIPCNTAHHYHGEIASAVEVPVLDMVSLTVSRVAQSHTGARKIGILASTAVTQTGLYQKRLEEAGLKAVLPSPEAQARLLEAIKAIKGGRLNESHRADYENAAAALERAGAEVFIIACTEFSLLGPPRSIGKPCVDALDVLVRETVATARAN